MDRTRLNYVLFFILSFLIIFIYTSFFAPKAPKKAPQERAEDKVSEQTQPPEEDQAKPVEEAELPALPQGKLITIKTPLYIGTVDTAGGRIVDWKLLKYKESTDSASHPVNLFKDSPPEFNTNLQLRGFQVPNPIPFEFDGNSETDFSEGGEVTLYWRSQEGIEVKKIYEINPSSYLLSQRFEVRNETQASVSETLFIESYGKIEQNGRGKDNKDFIAMVSDDVERVEKLPKETVIFKGLIGWFGFSDKYFLFSFLPSIGGETEVRLTNVEGEGFARAVFSYPSDVIPPGSTSVHKSDLYLGPVDYEILRSVGYGLQHTVNYGWVEVLAKPVLWFLKLLNQVFHNYGVSIIAITIIIRLIFLPLTLKSMASMKEMQVKMQELKPKMDALKERYKDDKAKQNAELMKLYTSHGINPLSSLGGCLPLLIQLPVFIALYDVLLYSIELRHSSFLWINDLSEPEHLFNIPGTGIPFRILPLAMGASWYVSQKMTPTAPAPGADNVMQMKIMEFMPLIFTVMFWGLPSGLILYWTVSNILSIVQQLYVNRSIAPKGGVKDADSDRKKRKDSV